MHSALYHGWLRHRRFAPRLHAFRYPLFMMYLDLAELDEVFRGRWFWSTRGYALARFDRADHLGDPAIPLGQAVRDLVQREAGVRPAGPIRLLTHLRYFGHCFNPVSFYYCFDAADERVDCVVAEVNNTPWGERHCYVLNRPSAGSPHERYQRYQSAKVFHVSPFMAMDMTYRWKLSEPGERLAIHIENHAADGKLFEATLALRRIPLNGWQRVRVLLDRKSTRLNSSHVALSRMPSSA